MKKPSIAILLLLTFNAIASPAYHSTNGEYDKTSPKFDAFEQKVIKEHLDNFEEWIQKIEAVEEKFPDKQKVLNGALQESIWLSSYTNMKNATPDQHSSALSLSLRYALALKRNGDKPSE